MKPNVQEFIKIFLNESKNGNLDGKSLNGIISYQGNDEKLIKLKESLRLLNDQQVETLIKLEKGGVLIEYLKILNVFVYKYKEIDFMQKDVGSILGFTNITLIRIENLYCIPSAIKFLKIWKFIQ